MLQAPGWEKEGVVGQGWRLGTGSLGGRGPSHAASVCAVSAPKMLLADNSDSLSWKVTESPQTGLWEVLTQGRLGMASAQGLICPAKKLPGPLSPPAPVTPG